MRLAVAVASSSLPTIADRSALSVRVGATGLNIDARDIPSYGRSASEAAERLQAQGVCVSQVACWEYNPLIPDAEQRKQVETAVAFAGSFGGNCTVVFGAGGLNVANPWIHDPANWTDDARRRAAEEIKPIAEKAEGAGTRLALEPHFANVCRNAETTLDLLGKIGSAAVGLSMDVVNYCRFEDYWDTARLVDELIEPLGPYCFAAHLKDITLEPRLVIHLDECPAGTGALDYPHMLRALDAVMDSDDWAVVEHTPLDRLPQAFEFIRGRAAAVGVQFKGEQHA